MTDVIGEMCECLLWSYSTICLDGLWVPRPKADNCTQDHMNFMQQWWSFNEISVLHRYQGSTKKLEVTKAVKMFIHQMLLQTNIMW